MSFLDHYGENIVKQDGRHHNEYVYGFSPGIKEQAGDDEKDVMEPASYHEVEGKDNGKEGKQEYR
jgi:hypothetical protein